MQKKWKQVLIGSGIAAAALAAATETARQAMTGYFVNVALDRQAPPRQLVPDRKISGSHVEEALLQKVERAGQALARKPLTTIAIHSRDGVRLVGHWMSVRNPKRIVIAMHGWRSSWSHDFGLIADFLQDNGCSVLFAEQRGQGSSGGEYMSFGLTERYDCLDWINWANERTGGTLPIYLCGISMGASTVLMAGGLALPENVRGIIADCGYTAPTAIWKHVAEQHLHMYYRACGATANRLAMKKTSVDPNGASCPEALRNCHVPVLFVHGTDDHFVPVEMTYENYKACAAPKRLFIVPGAEHGMSYPTDPRGYEEAVRSFWRAFDNGIPQ